MKYTVASLLLTACVLATAGCSSTRTHINTGPIAASTFNFINTGKPLPEYSEQDQQLHGAVQNAITQSLTRRNVSRVEQRGDVTVAYLIIMGNNVATTSISDYFGYGRDAYKLVDKAHDRYTSSANPNYFEAGTLLIDILDTQSWKILKRGYATRQLRPDLPLEQRKARLQEAVEEILRDVQFKP